MSFSQYFHGFYSVSEGKPNMHIVGFVLENGQEIGLHSLDNFVVERSQLLRSLKFPVRNLLKKQFLITPKPT